MEGRYDNSDGFIFFEPHIDLGLSEEERAAFEREDALFERKHVRINKPH